MSHAFTLTVPDELYESMQRNAQATNEPLEAVVLRTLRVSLPSLDGLPTDVANDLMQLEALDNEALHDIVHERVAEMDQDEIELLLEKNGDGTLSEVERARLLALHRAAHRTTLRKARAAVLLRFRGTQVPTVAELRERWGSGE